MRTMTFWKTLRALSHPVTLGALALLLLNDHLFRRLWPVWWTGKLGDVTWLFVTPFVLLAVLVWVAPGGEKVAVGLAFGLTGGVFVLAKTLPVFHDLTVRAAGVLFGFPIALRRDAMDLLTLPALLAAGWLWQRQPASKPAIASRGWLVLPLAVLLTMANSAAPDRGVSCVAVEDGRIVAQLSYFSYVYSEDGGFTWQSLASRVDCDGTGKNPFTDPEHSNIVYRFVPGDSIERSVDGGITWDEKFLLRPVAEAERAYYEKSLGNVIYANGPLSGTVDPITGNAVFAMGHQGVLIRDAGGEWRWVTVDRYGRLESYRPDSISKVVTLLSGEIFLAVGLGLLSLGFITAFVRRSWLRGCIWGFSQLLWCGVVVVFSPARDNYGYGSQIVSMAILVLALFVIPLSVDALIQFRRGAFRAFGQASLVAVTAALLFLLPYVLWTFNAIPYYKTAMIFAFILGVATLVLGAFWTRASQRLAKIQ